MISNYIRISLRNFRKNKSLPLINLIGLSIGMATCMLILLFVQNQLSYDRFHENADRIVRVIFKGHVQGQDMKEANVMPPVAKMMLENYPEVQQAARLVNAGSPIITYQNSSFRENAFAFVDPEFFEIFSLPFIRGDAATALTEPHTVVITDSIARKYFNKEDPIGKVINIKGGNDFYKVTGVISQVPENSHFHFDFFASMRSWPDAQSTSFMISGYYTYLLLPKGYDYRQLEAKLPESFDKHISPQLQKSMGMNLVDFRKKGNDLGLFLQPLTDIHLHSNLTGELSQPGNLNYVYIFSAVAVFMLLIACINFINLSTASSGKRSREVGIRKVLGSGKSALVFRFLTESLLLTCLAGLLAVVMVYLLLPYFNHLAHLHLSLNFADQPYLLTAFLGLILLTGFLAGSYPAFFLSAFKPVSVLKGKLPIGKTSVTMRSGLVVFQFFISVLLLTGTMVVYKQLVFIQNIQLGYDKNRVMILPETWMLGQNQEAFRQQLMQDPRIENISISGYLPAGASYSNNFVIYPENEDTRLVQTLRYDVDYNYISTLGIEMLSGRNFSRDFGTDSAGIILNEAAARELGWGKNALGKTVSRRDNDGSIARLKVIGIVKNFHFKSLHETISPLVMVLNRDAGTTILKINTNDVSSLLSSIKSKWDSFSPEGAFNYSFLDERISKTYEAEKTLNLILGIFAGLTIMVACLGLFGLVTFTAEQRTREIGIRKVLGAETGLIVGLLSKDLLKLVCIALLVAIPAGWLTMHQWLQDFAYRTNLSWWIFALAGLAALSVALITMSFRTMQAARANPIKSLRSE
jgi:putative ABC transport system permease protein